jgi:hypothetical protein
VARVSDIKADHWVVYRYYSKYLVVLAGDPLPTGVIAGYKKKDQADKLADFANAQTFSFRHGIFARIALEKARAVNDLEELIRQYSETV